MPTPIQTGTFQTPQAPEYEIIKIPEVGEPGRDALKQQCFDLRMAVFTHEQGFPLECEIDDADETATHFLLRLVPSSEPIGDHTLRTRRRLLQAQPTRRAQEVSQIPLRPRALVLALHDWVVRDARERGAAPRSYVRCVSRSQIPVKTFYAKATSSMRTGRPAPENGRPAADSGASGSESEPASRSAADLARDPSSRGALPDSALSSYGGHNQT